MSIPVPPIAKLATPIVFWKKEGRIAISPKNSAPTKVILFKTFLRYFIVWVPGRIPGIKPPLF